MPMPDSLARLARSSNAFGFDLYRRIRETPGNLVISPASLTTALTMTFGGAAGETAAQMRRVLHLEGSADEAMVAAGELSRSLQDPSRPITFRIANQLFLDRGYELVPAYVEATRAAFGAPVERLDFQAAPEPARRRINDWVEERTERRVKDLIPEGGVNNLVRLVIANAIYFLGDWAFPFDPQSTRPAPFHLSASEVLQVPTMHRTGLFHIAWQEGVTALEILYKGLELSMLFLVPDAVTGLADLEAGLDAAKLAVLTGAMKGELVSLFLPRFELKSVASLSLRGDLEALGMPLAFDPDGADFRGMANPPHPDDLLSIDKVFHRAFVRVDEKGTEAAAATAVVMRTRGLQPEARLLRVDRPFLFLLRDNASGLILFLGRVSDPGRP
jgi:serpin B